MHLFVFHHSLLQLVEMKKKYEDAREARNAKETEMSACSSEVKQISSQKAKCDKSYDQACLEITKITSKLATWSRAGKDARTGLAALEAEHAWIAAEKGFFGRRDSDFDFESRNVGESRGRLKVLKEEQVPQTARFNALIIDDYTRTLLQCFMCID
jgi:uncharacterized protein (DUF3084 family)